MPINYFPSGGKDNTQSSGRHASTNTESDDDGNNDDDIVMTMSKESLICALTQLPFVDPVQKYIA